MEQTNMNQKIISIRELFNNIRDTLSRDQLDQIRINIYKNEAIHNYYIKNDKLTSKQTKKSNDAATYLNKLYDDLLKQNKYQYNPYGLDLLFSKDDYYRPIEIKSVFDGNYVLYECNGDKDELLYVYESFEKTKPYLRDLIDFYNTKGEWKTQLSISVIFKS